MVETHTLLGRTLKNHHKSVTASRRIVFETLHGQEPLSMQALVTRCKNKVNRASIYRTIALFERLGIVQRLQIGWKYKLELSSDFNYHHHHLTCARCGIILALPEDKQLESRLQHLAKNLKFYPQDHQIEIRGLCAACHSLQ
jgi:Fur family ferric uptake transcriptional regulator